ncbi:hypothetical protein QQ045_002811 [Rhodiola kirilowii]
MELRWLLPTIDRNLVYCDYKCSLILLSRKFDWCCIVVLKWAAESLLQFDRFGMDRFWSSLRTEDRIQRMVRLTAWIAVLCIQVLFLLLVVAFAVVVLSFSPSRCILFLIKK